MVFQFLLGRSVRYLHDLVLVVQEHKWYLMLEVKLLLKVLCCARHSLAFVFPRGLSILQALVIVWPVSHDHKGIAPHPVRKDASEKFKHGLQIFVEARAGSIHN